MPTPAHFLTQPSWTTYDGFRPYYHIPSNRPDPELIASLDASCIPGIASMQRYGMAIDIPYLNDLTGKIDTKIAELRRDILDIIPQDVLSILDPTAEAEQAANAELSMVEMHSEDGEVQTFGLLESNSSSNVYSDSYIESFFKHNLNLDSPTQLAALLFKHLNVGRGKRLKTSKGSNKISTDKEQLNNLKADHPVIPKILEYRAYSKAKSTYTTKLPLVAIRHPKSLNSPCYLCGRRHYEEVYRVHTTLLLTRTNTGRLASKNPNLQNIPARSELGKWIRMAFIPEVGYVFLDADLSQAELRLLGHRAQEARILEIFRNGEDIHVKTAMYAFNITDPKLVDKELHRAPCKNVNFGIVYGLTADGLYDQMVLTYAVAGKPLPSWITPQWCLSFIEQWYGIYPGVRGYLALEHRRAHQYGFVWTEYGRTRLIPEVYSVQKHIQEAGERQAGNAGIQGTCADMVHDIIRVTDDYFSEYQPYVLKLPEKDHSYPLMSIHDEGIVETPVHMAEKNKPAMVQLMTGTSEHWMDPTLPADGKILQRWEK